MGSGLANQHTKDRKDINDKSLGSHFRVCVSCPYYPNLFYLFSLGNWVLKFLKFKYRMG